MVSLYKLTTELDALLSRTDDEDGDADQWIVDLEAQLQVDVHAKMDRCAQLVRQLTADAAALKAEEQRFKARHKSVTTHLQSLKRYMVDCMERLVQPDSEGKRKIRSEFVVYLQKNPMSVDRDKCNLLEIDDKYVEYIPRIKASDILHDIKSTGVVPDGVELFPVEHSVRIK